MADRLLAESYEGARLIEKRRGVCDECRKCKGVEGGPGCVKCARARWYRYLLSGNCPVHKAASCGGVVIWLR